VSAAEPVIAVNGNLRAGFFDASLHLLIRPSHLETFIADLAQLDKALAGSAVLQAEGPENVVKIALEGLRHGRVLCRGNTAVKGNALSFQFETDQTQLAPLLRWFKSVLSRYDDERLDEGG
jgi:hypothetical protein